MSFVNREPQYLAGERIYQSSNRTSFGVEDKTSITLILYALLAAAIIYQLLHQAELLPGLSILDIFWNCLVYIIPPRLLASLDRPSTTFSMHQVFTAQTTYQGHAAKSDALRRIMNIGQNGFFNSFAGVAKHSRIKSLSQPDGSPPGLGNWDNSCYQNSVIQGLASLKTLPEFLKQASTKSLEIDSDHPRTTLALQQVLESLNDPSNSSTRLWTPAALKSMSSWQQQDAQEYFSKVLDEMDKELRKAFEASHLKLDNISPIPGSTEAKAEETDPPIGVDDTCKPRNIVSEGLDVQVSRPLKSVPISNPLEGLLAQRVGCKRCGHSDGLSLIPFNCLTVPLGRDVYYDVRECLDEYTALEDIQGVDCAKCTLLSSKDKLEHMLQQSKEAIPSSAASRIQHLASARIGAIDEALENDDFSDFTLSKKCKIAPGSRVATTKSRQAVIARPPKSLVIHFNRSVFNERTGELSKNYTDVRFQNRLNLGLWCLGGKSVHEEDETVEEWDMDPSESLLRGFESDGDPTGPVYEIRAVVTHYGRHENGHYVCYRKFPRPPGPILKEGESAAQDDNGAGAKDEMQNQPIAHQWWRLSDDDVMRVSEATVLDQGGVFMLFYDRIEDASVHPIDLQKPTADAVDRALDSENTNPTYAEDISNEPSPCEGGSNRNDERLLIPAESVSSYSSDETEVSLLEDIPGNQRSGATTPAALTSSTRTGFDADIRESSCDRIASPSETSLMVMAN